MHYRVSTQWVCALCLAALALFPSVPARAQATDSDGDGMSDAAEAVLGSDPKVADAFANVVTRKPSEKVTDKGRFVAGVGLANAGADRFVWRVEFADTWPQGNANFILYVDADNDPKTGRADHGCEWMLRVTNGEGGNTAYAAGGQAATAGLPRVFLDGRFVYLSYDLDLKQQEGKSLFRLMVLSESWEPHQGVDSVSYFAAQGPAIGSRPKLKMDSDLTVSQGMEQTYGPRTVDRLLEAPENVRLPIFGCELQGFRFVPAEYRADYVRRTGSPGRIAAKVPRDGSFFPGFIFYDGGGREVIGLYVNGARQGVAVASWDDNDQHLFFLSKPLALKKGDLVELRALSSEGGYMTEDLVLLAKKPAPKAPAYEFRHLEAGPNRITWVTTWPVACTVELGDGRKITESLAMNNHRVFVPGFGQGQAIRYRVTATTREGKPVASAWQAYAWKPPVMRTKAAGSLSLSVTVPESLRLQSWPVTGGVPFAKGVLGSEANLALLDAAGKPVAFQGSVTGRWADGSVKWVLLDFRHSGSSAEYRVRFGPNVGAKAPAAPAAPAPALGTLALVDAAGKSFAADLSGLRPEEPGALRACLYGAGRFKDPSGAGKLAYEACVHRYPGTPWARVLLTFTNDCPESDFTTIRSLKWEVPVKAAQPAFVRQHTDDHYAASAGEGKRWSGPVGALFVRDFWQNYPLDAEAGPEGSSVWLLPPLKADEYASAKGTVDEHRLYYWFDPLGDAGGYKLRQGMSKTHEIWLGLDGSTPPYDRPLVAACTPKWYADTQAFGQLAVADAKREVVRDYDKKITETLDAYLSNRERNREFGQFNFGDWWGEREINWGNIEYDTQHAFFLQFVRSGDLRFLQAGEEAERHNRDVDTVHVHSDPGRVGKVYAHCIGHVGNYLQKSPLEGPNRGSPQGGFTPSHTWCEGHTGHYFLTGDRRSLETARKIADVYGSYGTTNYDFHNCREPGWQLIFMMAVYRATGDPFYLNGSRIMVERVLERQTEQPALGTAGGGWRRRMVPGHCLCEPAHYGNAGFMVGVLLTGLRWYHEETGDPRVARSIHLGARFLIEDMWVPEVKGFRYTTCPASSAGPWSNFLLFDGIAYAYRLTGDKELAKALSAGTDAAIASMSGMGKSFTMYIRVTPHIMETLAQLRESPVLPLPALSVVLPPPLSGSGTVKLDAAGSRWPKGATGRMTWDFGDGSKGAGEKVEHSYARGGKYRVVLALESAAGNATAEAVVSIPPQELAAVGTGKAVVVEAEKLAGEGGGKARIATGRVGASGAIVTNWHADVGHWLEWKVAVPAAGRYRVLYKYCSDSPRPRRDLLVDGRTPSDACKEILFPTTGGFSTGRDDWAYLTLGGDTPVLLDLTAGEHALRMSNLGDGLALDWIALIRQE